MNDENYIRKAVELADGFEADISECGQYQINWFKPLGRVMTAADWWVYDALAAQLVRQVDALPCGEIEAWTRRSLSWLEDENNDGAAIGRHDGPDRTMNTIRAIVDSGVLND